VREDHEQAIFGAAFNFNVSPHFPPVFATVGANRVTVYQCPSDGSLVPQFVHGDPDAEENFYTVAWSYVRDFFVPVMAFAGNKGLIRVIYCYFDKPRPVKTLNGHGSAVNEVRFHPSMPVLLFSASKDHSIR
jgi:polycomb protein EED